MESPDPNPDPVRRRGASSFVLLVAAVLVAPAVRAQADDNETPRVSLDGFGTLGWVHSSEDQADFLGGLLIAEGAGHRREWSPEVDSRLGVQLQAAFTPRLSGVVQVISEQRHDGSYRPRVEWANLTFEPVPELELRVGRSVLASFLVSDYRKVGYINPWVRPPVELYSIVPVTSSDGVDLAYRLDAGRFTHTLRADFGRSDVRFSEGGSASARHMWGISDTIEYGALTLRASYRRAALRIPDYNELFDAFRQFGQEGGAIADRYDADGRRMEFAGVAAMYDPGDWFAMGEWAHVRSHSAIGERSAWYVSAGYRRGPWTPYLTHARARIHGDTTEPGLTISGLPPELVETASGLNAALSGLLGSIPAQQTSSLGLRWDFRSNLALKLQYDYTDVGAGSPGIVGNIQPGFRTGDRLELFSVSLDFLF